MYLFAYLQISFDTRFLKISKNICVNRQVLTTRDVLVGLASDLKDICDLSYFKHYGKFPTTYSRIYICTYYLCTYPYRLLLASKQVGTSTFNRKVAKCTRNAKKRALKFLNVPIQSLQSTHPKYWDLDCPMAMIIQILGLI